MNADPNAPGVADPGEDADRPTPDEIAADDAGGTELAEEIDEGETPAGAGGGASKP